MSTGRRWGRGREKRRKEERREEEGRGKKGRTGQDRTGRFWGTGLLRIQDFCTSQNSIYCKEWFFTRLGKGLLIFKIKGISCFLNWAIRSTIKSSFVER